LAAVSAGSDVNPKVQVVLHFLRDRRWLGENGATIFSRYRTTAERVLEALCEAFPDEPGALCAGGAPSIVQRGQERWIVAREPIKKRMQDGEIRLVCATDAAWGDLNLHGLGAQLNVDMPWTPSRLEQRKGRARHIGQIRDNVHVLNLGYAGTVKD
jgi:ERCC4-related helicase